MRLSKAIRKNRAYWDRVSDQYQARHAPQLNRPDPGWGVWGHPEAELRVLEEVAAKDVLELGCGGAQWSIALALRGARPVAFDLSLAQLRHARANMAAAGVTFPLVHGAAEHVPLADASFDIVFCDHGAMTFADPRHTVPEAARLLRPGGVFAFNMTGPLVYLCLDEDDEITTSLHNDYFSLHRLESEETVEYQLPYGEWIRLFRRHGFVIEDLIELRAPADGLTTYEDFAPFEWQRRWPAQNIWKARKA